MNASTRISLRLWSSLDLCGTVWFVRFIVRVRPKQESFRTAKLSETWYMAFYQQIGLMKSHFDPSFLLDNNSRLYYVINFCCNAVSFLRLTEHFHFVSFSQNIEKRGENLDLRRWSAISNGTVTMGWMGTPWHVRVRDKRRISSQRRERISASDVALSADAYVVPTFWGWL